MAQRPQGGRYEDYSRKTAVYSRTQAAPREYPPAQASAPRQAYAAPSETAQYARSNYGKAPAPKGNAPKHAARHAAKRSSAGARVAKGIAIVLGILLAIVLAFALWFTISLNNRLEAADVEGAQTKPYLVDAPLDKPFYLLVLGSDSREGASYENRDAYQDGQQRSDVIMLARIDAPSRQVTLVTIPRDTYYQHADGTVTKINEAYNSGGIAGMVQAVSQVTGEDISHYAAVHVSQLEAIVESLGGVEVYVDRDLSVLDYQTGEEIALHEGKQVLNGKQAQAFVRARHEYSREGEAQDVSRQGNVRTFAQAIAKKVVDRPVWQLPGVVLDLAQYVETDLRAFDLIRLGLMFSGGKATIYDCTGPTEGYTAEELGGMWICYPNPEGWAELMRQVDAGVEPGKIDYAATQVVPGAAA